MKRTFSLAGAGCCFYIYPYDDEHQHPDDLPRFYRFSRVALVWIWLEYREPSPFALWWAAFPPC